MTGLDASEVASERAALRVVLPVMAITALTCWACALIVAQRAPWVPDLYNLVYANARPHRPEGTAAFLFVFPTFLTLGTAGVAAYLQGWINPRPSRFPLEIRIAFLTLWAALFFGLSVHRSRVVWLHFA